MAILLNLVKYKTDDLGGAEKPLIRQIIDYCLEHYHFMELGAYRARLDKKSFVN